MGDHKAHCWLSLKAPSACQVRKGTEVDPEPWIADATDGVENGMTESACTIQPIRGSGTANFRKCFSQKSFTKRRTDSSYEGTRITNRLFNDMFHSFLAQLLAKPEQTFKNRGLNMFVYIDQKQQQRGTVQCTRMV